MSREHFIYISMGMGVLCLALLILKRKVLPKEFIWLRLFFFNWVVIEITAFVIAKMKLPNLPLLHLYTLIEFISLSLFFGAILKHRAKLSARIRIFTIIGALLIVANSVFLQTIFGHNSYAKSLSNLTIIFYALIFIFELISDKIEAPYRKLFALINSSLLIYYMGTFLIFLLSDFLFRTDHVLLTNIWAVNIALNNFLIIMVLAGIFRELPNKLLKT